MPRGVGGTRIDQESLRRVLRGRRLAAVGEAQEVRGLTRLCRGGLIRPPWGPETAASAQMQIV